MEINRSVFIRINVMNTNIYKWRQSQLEKRHLTSLSYNSLSLISLYFILMYIITRFNTVLNT